MTAIYLGEWGMERERNFPGKAHKSLCYVVLALSLLLVLPNSFAQGSSAGKDDPFQGSLFTMKGWLGKIYTKRGKDVFISGIIMPLKGFLVSYKSEEADERNAAFAFLWGVTDATEGKMWCANNDYTRTTVFEAVDEGLKKLNQSRYNERAAYVITEILEKKYPCKKTMSVSNASTGSAQDIKDDPLQKSILAGEGLAGEQIIKQGEDMFAPNISLKNFLVSYNSENSREDDALYAFFLGMFDATEGKEWCGYKVYKTITILERIHLGFKKLDQSRYDERAAYVITGFLENEIPCKKER